MLDEPFGALDRKLREGMQEEVRDLQRRLGLTTVFITHDQEEALVLSDRIAVMDAGRILQVGGPEAIYSDPVDLFTASFLGESNLFGAQVRAAGPDGLELVLDGEGTVRAPLPASGGLAPGGRVTLLVRPEHLVPAAETRPTDARIKARLIEAVFLGAWVKWRLETLPLPGRPARPLILRRPAGGAPPLPGEVVELGWAAADSRVLVR